MIFSLAVAVEYHFDFRGFKGFKLSFSYVYKTYQQIELMPRVVYLIRISTYISEQILTDKSASLGTSALPG